ncbi:MAG: hypothetical protein LC104_18285 [Bacteroidales bacterium]|nr:hypothetical protein [Bacteroidales bacterium]
MHTNGHSAATPAPTSPPRRLWLGALILILVLMLPISLIVFVFPFFQQEPFESLNELQPESIRSLQVRLLIRAEIDASLEGQSDIGPYFADSTDFAALLEPLRVAKEVTAFPDAQGPILGEYRILTQENRRGTIRLYWVRDPGAKADSPARLRFKIGMKKYEGGTAIAVIRAAEVAAARGRDTRQ